MKRIYLFVLLICLLGGCVNSEPNTNNNQTGINVANLNGNSNTIGVTTTDANINTAAVAVTTNYIEARFLPVLHLHPDDPYRPSTVSWLLPRAELRYEGNSNPILKKGEINETNLQQQAQGGQSSGGDDKATKFYLDYPDDSQRDETRRGNLEEFSCYVHITRQSDPMEIQYWFYYPYNGSIAPVLDIAHEGDWEHITVRLKPDRSAIDKIYYSAHDEQHSRWVDAAGHTTSDGRPIVYSAKHTHGSYSTAGKWDTAAQP